MTPQTSSSAPPCASEPREGSSPAAPITNPISLARLRVLWDPEDPSFVTDLLGIFLADATDRLRVIHRALAAGDARGLAAAAHSLKGASSSIGAQDVAQSCQRLVSFRDRPLTDEASEIVQDVEEALARVEIAVARQDTSTLCVRLPGAS